MRVSAPGEDIAPALDEEVINALSITTDSDLVHSEASPYYYTHSDFLQNASSQEESRMVRLAIANIARASDTQHLEVDARAEALRAKGPSVDRHVITLPYSKNTVLAGLALGVSVAFERNSRIAHQRRLRLAFGHVAVKYPFLQAGNQIASDSLAVFKHKYNEYMSQSDTSASGLWANPNIAGKGFSAELGQIEQLGLWNVVQGLDDAIVQLRDDTDLHEQLGLELTKVYDYSGEGKIDYAFRVIGYDPRFIAIERKRPVFDLGAPQVVKSSLFVLDTKQLSNSQRDLILNEIASEGDDSNQSEDSRLAQKSLRFRIGSEIIEPYIVDPSIRNSDFKLFPASALYYVLARRPELSGL